MVKNCRKVSTLAPSVGQTRWPTEIYYTLIETSCIRDCIDENDDEVISKYNSMLLWRVNSSSPDLFRKDICKIFKNINLDWKNNIFDNLLDICSQECKPDCITKKYLTELKEPVVDELNQLKQNVKIEFEQNS